MVPISKISSLSPDQCSKTSPPSAKRQRSQPSSPSPAKKKQSTSSIEKVSSLTMPSILHAGWPILSKYEEKRIVTHLLEHPKGNKLTFDNAQSFACEHAVEIIHENFHFQMSCVQIEWFYDLLLKHPQISFKYRHWFEDQNGLQPMNGDAIDIKLWHIKEFLRTE